jgi:2-iminoacetate synthase
VPRVTLTPEEIEREADAIVDQGIREVLLLTGEAPAKVGVGYLERAIHLVKERFDAVFLEVFPMKTEDYARVVDAGATGLVLYQETYDHLLYKKFHQAGRKRNFLWRLGGPDRAAAAGMPTVGLGALLGLGDWRYETIALVHHARWLFHAYDGLQITVSFPRLRTPFRGFEVPHPIDDEALVHMMSAIRLLLPEAGLVLSTRESSQLRDFLAPRLIAKMSAGSQTNPGGYAGLYRTEGTHHQFAVEDARSVAEVASSLRAAGLVVQGLDPTL